ncbi:hypothetical protein COB72_01310 [bacterium]|nr:MAG: hypothetical protein COB72_01310 [bacterium]
MLITDDFINWLSRFKCWIKHCIPNSLTGPIMVVMLDIRISRSPQMLLANGDNAIKTFMLD